MGNIDRHLPAYIRLFKWKLIDICITKGRFDYFKDLIDRKVLKKIVQCIINPKDHIVFSNEINIKDDSMKDCEDLENYIMYHEYTECNLLRRRAINNFFSLVLFNEKGISKTLQLFLDYCPEIVTYVEKVKRFPNDHLYFKKFYCAEDADDVCGVQQLDRVVVASRGNLIARHWKSKQVNCDDYEFDQIPIESDIVLDVLHENCSFIRKVNDEEVVVESYWNNHKTNLIFAFAPFINHISYMSSLEEYAADSWYYCLLDGMCNDSYNRAALWIFHRDWSETLDDIESALKFQNLMRLKKNMRSEGVDEVDDPFEIRPQPEEVLNEYREVDCEKLELRLYQAELVQPALQGDNVVIVAPTGSGKTEVAIHAALHHIERRAEKRLASRVVMLVPKIPLVDQQKNRFLKYCQGEYIVEGFHGSEKSSDGCGRKDEVLNSHIVIMTPQILINMWQSVRKSERLYIADFSMVIFDEVHKTTGNHPYSEIAKLIQMYNGPKPQIIGLTASLNVKAALMEDKTRMLSEIYKLLAMLDACKLSTIQNKESLEMLEKVVPKPDDSVIICEQQPDENATIRSFIRRYLKNLHESLIKEIEKLITGKHCSSAAFRKLCDKRLNLDDTEYYETWLQTVHQRLYRLESAAKESANLNVKYLRIVSEARSIVEVMPAYVAFDFIKEKYDEFTNNDNPYASEFMKYRDNLEQRKTNPDDNADPKIVHDLKKIISDQFKEKPTSRAIIFVAQRATAKNVCDFLNKSKILNEEGADDDQFGYVLGSNNQGSVKQSSAEQKMTIDKFNKGLLKVIVATSVVEEGLDVPACNLIIKYNCSSGSAVQLTQIRGRARAVDSRSILLTVDSKVNENEKRGLIAEMNMRKCVGYIQKMTAKQLANEVEKEKQQMLKLREQEKKELFNREQQLRNKAYAVGCSHCSKEFCRSDAVKRIFSNYIIVDPNVWEYFELEIKKPSKNIINAESMQPLCKLKCACDTFVGKAFKQRGVYVPHLDIKQLTFRNLNSPNQEGETKKKWTSVEEELFYIAEATETDFKQMMHALDGDEKSIRKKQQLDMQAIQQLEIVQATLREQQRGKKYLKNEPFDDEEEP